MPMTFHQPVKWGMSVVNGQEVIASAKKYGVGYWLLTLRNGSWVDPRARQPLRDDFPKGYRDMYSANPQTLAVKTDKEAREIMLALAATGNIVTEAKHEAHLTGYQVRDARAKLSLSAAEAATLVGLNDGAAWRRWERGGVSGPGAVLLTALVESPAVREHFHIVNNDVAA